MTKGYVHLYWGDGKGKTTAAAGQAVRALGGGLRVVFVQFLKDGKSGELGPLRQLGAVVLSGSSGGKLASRMTREEQQETTLQNTMLLRQARSIPCDMLILDEACAAWQMKMIDRPLLKDTVLKRPEGEEIILTGREPPSWMREAADYSTSMCCVSHPYRQGILARAGVEY